MTQDIEKQAREFLSKRWSLDFPDDPILSINHALDLLSAYGSSEYERGLRDGHERVAQIADNVAIEVGGNFSETHRLNTGLNKFRDQLEAAIRQISEGGY